MKNDFLWWKNGVIYQIYPRSFADSNHDGIGDLNGIRSKLDYLAELGIDAIWLSPIYPSPDADFGYDVSDYVGIDPKFGSMADFDKLIEEAHQRNIKIVLDLVLNHTSEEHEWFKQSRSSRDNPYRDWYIWADGKPGRKFPNNWEAVFGGKGWEYDAQTGQYYYHMFYKEQPDVNWRNPKVRKAVLDVFRFWADKGVDGFRLDVFNVYFKHEGFPDNPSKFGIRGFDRQEHLYDCDQPEMFPLLAEIREILDSFPERYAVGETFLANAEKAAKYCAPGYLHGTFNFRMLEQPWKAGRILKTITDWQNSLSLDTWPTHVMNNHDVKRSATRFGRGEDDDRLKLSAALLLTLQGTPYLYYGEEIGMRDVPVKRSEIKDPIGRRYWPIYIGRDGCRSPMQWDSSINAGFSEKTPWLPVHENFVVRNVEAQRKDPASLFNFYRKLLRLRKDYEALHNGMFQVLTQDPHSILAYLRSTKTQNVLVVMNFGRRAINFVFGAHLANHSWNLLLSNKRETLNIHDRELKLQGEEFCILLMDE